MMYKLKNVFYKLWISLSGMRGDIVQNNTRTPTTTKIITVTAYNAYTKPSNASVKDSFRE